MNVWVVIFLCDCDCRHDGALKNRGWVFLDKEIIVIFHGGRLLINLFGIYVRHPSEMF